MSWIAILLASIALLHEGVKSEIYSAITDIQPLLDTHRGVIENIQNYVRMEEHRLEIMKTYLEHYQREHEKMVGEHDYIGNPLNAFCLIKRLTLDLNSVEHYATLAHTPFQKDLNVYLPTTVDLEGAGTALLRLQNTYNLNVSQLAQGVLRGNYSYGKKQYDEQTLPLTSSDMFEIGRRAYLEFDFENAILWFMEALNKLQSRSNNEIVNFGEANIVDWIRMSYKVLGDFKNAIPWTERLLVLKPDHENASKDLVELKDKFLKQKLAEDSQVEHAPEESNLSFIKERQPAAARYKDSFYHVLCRGDHHLPPNVTKNLNCFYKSGPEPFLKLARIRSEQLYANPEVMLFHDVISDDEIQFVINMAKSRLKRATVNNGTGMPVAASFRVSKTGWLADSDSDVVARLSQRVIDFTDLSMETAESLQIANYGIGGHYDYHYDFFKSDNVQAHVGNRIATVLFYMSNVEQGGATAFVTHGLSVFPVKNAAIFWLNLHPSGEPDMTSNHGACPVLRGSKWVANKWIHIIGQEFRKPCTLQHEK